MADVTVADRSQLNAAIANARAAASTEDDRITISGATPTTNTIAINTQLAFQGSPTTGSLTLVGNLNGSSSVAVSGFTGTNTATFTGTLTQAGGFVTTDASRVQLNGSLSASGVAFNAANGSVLRVAAGSQITNTSGIVIAGGGAFTVVNAGTIADGDGSDVINTSAAVTLLNTGTISNRTNVAAGANGVGSRITNAQSGVLAGGSSQQFGAGANLGNNGTIDNYGTISGSAALASNAGTLSGGTGITANLYAGSSTGTVRLGAGSTLSLYTGTGTSNAGIATTDPLTGQAVTLQNAGTNAAAIVGRIALGSSGTLALRGTGDGTTANGAAGTLDISTVSGATTLNKSDTGTFVLTGVYGSALATNVTAGTLNIRNAGALGTTGTTAVSSGATLQLQNTIAVGAKPLSIAGSGSGMANGALQNVSDANTYAGAITLSAAARINVDSGSLSLSGGITGATSPRALTLGGAGGTGTVSSVIGTNIASVTKDGANTWVLTGANTYTGGTTIGSGTLQLNNSGGNALANDGRVTFANDTNTTAQLTASTSETIGSLTGGNASSTVSIAASQTLTVGGDGTTDGVYAGVINANGTGRLSKTGAGTQTLTGNSTAFTGTVAVTAGTLAVNGTLGDTANRAATITVGDGTVGSGTLGGSGTVAGSVNILNGGTISAGNSPGTLSTGNLTLATGATLTEEVTGTTADAYDQVNVTGSVSLAGTLDLRVTGTFASTVGQNLVFINNDLTDTVTGRFDALRLNGASVALSNSNTFSVDGRSYQLNYQAGDGNDVAIRDITPAPFDPGPPGPTPGNDNLVGTAGPDTISLGQGADTFSAGGGADLVYGNQGDDLIYGNLDNDTIYGGQDNDRVYGGQGDDRLFGNAGNDVLFGNLGNDIVYGNQGNDIVYGNQGADILFGGQGNDVLYGGQGEDTLVGGIGDDILVGGLGADRYVFGANSGRDLILGFNQGEGDRLALGGQTYTVSSAQNGDALLTLSGGGVVDLAGIRAEQVNANYFAA